MLEAAQLAKQLEHPVRLTWSRGDEVQHGFYRAQSLQELEVTLDARNGLTGWRHQTVCPTIRSTFQEGATDPAAFELDQDFSNLPFRIPNVRLEASVSTRARSAPRAASAEGRRVPTGPWCRGTRFRHRRSAAGAPHPRELQVS